MANSSAYEGAPHCPARIGRRIAGGAAFISALMTSAAIVGPAHGQGAALEEIVVTAERREMAIQDTPISILAFSADTLDIKNVEDLFDLSEIAPNLDIKGSRGFGNLSPTFQIRGIAGGGGTTSERGVGLYIDGIYIPRTNGAIFNVLDFDRVEVLRGPQGTLFGRNSTGGAIRIFTQKPEFEPSAYIRAAAGNFDRSDIVGMINVPVNEYLALRFQGGLMDLDGYVERGTQMLGGRNDKVGHFQARYTPSSDITADIGILYSDQESNGTPQDLETFDMRPGLEGVWEGNYGDWVSDFLENAGQDPIQPFNDPRFVLDDYTMPDFCFLDDAHPDWDEACEQHSDSEFLQVDATVEWAVNEDVTLTSITGFNDLDFSGVNDWQMIGTERRPADVSSETFYQEFQVNAALFDNAVDVVTGGNYFHETSKSDNMVITRRGTSIPDPFFQDPVTGVYGHPNGDGDAGLFVNGHEAQTQKSNSWGIFGNATWHLTEKLDFTGGLRFAYDKKNLVSTQFASAAFNPATGNLTRDQRKESWSQLDWRATLDYQVADAHMVYATVSKAYQAGALVASEGRVPPGQPTPYSIGAIPPEKVINLEAGARTEWLDGRLRINPTAYYMFWTNRQAAQQVQCAPEEIPETCPIGFRIEVVNSGDVDIYGFELDTQLAVTDRLTLDGSVGVVGYDLGPEAPFPYLFPAPSSPNFNVGGQYEQPLDGLGSLLFSLSFTYTGDQRTHPTSGGDSDYLMPGYGLLNGQIRWASDDRQTFITVFANNLLDKHYATYATRFGGGYWDVGGPPRGGGAPFRSARNVTRGRPFSWGVRMEHNF